MPRDLHALPRRERSIESSARGFEPSLQRFDLALARICAWERRERLKLFQENGDRLLEVQCF
jgi:hypothetical protein